MSTNLMENEEEMAEGTAVRIGSPFINRELSWLEFNHRVLEEAWDETNPLLERVKFLGIAASNLDEFFEVRVAGQKQLVESGRGKVTVDGMAPEDQLTATQLRLGIMVEEKYRCWRESILPGLEENNIHFRTYPDIEEAGRWHFESFFRQEVLPVLTPLAVDPTHPFPQLLNKSMNVIVELNDGRNNRDIIVQVPRMFPRVLRVPDGEGNYTFVFLADIIRHHVGELFPGFEVAGVHLFRVTRNSNLYLDEEETENLLSAMEAELKGRNRGRAVRLEVQRDCPRSVRERLLATFQLTEADLYVVDGPINFRRLMPVPGLIDRPELKDAHFRAATLSVGKASMFQAIRNGDILLHHPYESFQPVIDFIDQAADDPTVLAIKQTLYRTSGDSPFVHAMIRAAQKGKQVVAVIEIKARFDEEANIRWARMLEEAGVHVAYGIVGLKTHCKAALVVKKDEDGLRRYVHLGTGNYHPSTARLYTDVGLMTCREEIGQDVAALFNTLTGVPKAPPMNQLLVSPFTFHAGMIERIRRETDHARNGRPSGITAKMNSLLENEIIEALYEASQAGVKVRLIVRGICALRPGVPGMSENIEVHSIVGRFLEHSRLFRFENAGDEEILLGSADWMQRNCFVRIESCVPIQEPALREKASSILDACWKDNVKGRLILEDGTSTRIKDGKEAFNSQEYFIKQAEESRQKVLQEGRVPRPGSEYFE